MRTRIADTPPKVCECCGEHYYRRDNEKRRNWMGRRFCSHRCAQRGRSSYIAPSSPRGCWLILGGGPGISKDREEVAIILRDPRGKERLVRVTARTLATLLELTEAAEEARSVPH